MSTYEPTAWEISGKAVKKIQFLIDANHVTVPQVADTIGVPHKAMLDVLDGIAHPTESLIRKCADFFGVTYEFITGQESPSKGSAGKGGSGKGGSAKGSRSGSAASARGGSSGTARGGADRSSATLNVRTIATRFQALVELLIEKGVITARDYHEKVKKVEERTG